MGLYSVLLARFYVLVVYLFLVYFVVFVYVHVFKFFILFVFLLFSGCLQSWAICLGLVFVFTLVGDLLGVIVCVCYIFYVLSIYYRSIVYYIWLIFGIGVFFACGGLWAMFFCVIFFSRSRAFASST